jgi:hypothetical protein
MANASDLDPKEFPGIAKIPELPGMSREQMGRDVQHPKAAEVIKTLFAQDGPSSLQPGGAAPDFELPRLGGPNAGERVRLSNHFESEGSGRPVALVFGSYT